MFDISKECAKGKLFHLTRIVQKELHFLTMVYMHALSWQLWNIILALKAIENQRWKAKV